MFRFHKLKMAEHVVIKTAHPRYLTVEVEKTRRAAGIGRDTGLFRVPQVLEYDEKNGQAVFERIPGLRTIREAGGSRRNAAAMAEKIGHALAAVHRDLKLPAEFVRPIPEAFADGGGDVFLHGDFGLKNICFEAGSLEPVILDWQFTDMHGGEASFGSRFFDIVWFVNTLIWIPTFGHFAVDPVAPLARRFVRAYYETAGIPYDGEALSRYARRFFEVKRPERRGGSRRNYIFLPRCHAMTRRFVRMLEKGPGRV